MSHGLFNNVPSYYSMFLVLEHGSHIAVYSGSEGSELSFKYINSWSHVVVVAAVISEAV